MRCRLAEPQELHQPQSLNHFPLLRCLLPSFLLLPLSFFLTLYLFIFLLPFSTITQSSSSSYSSSTTTATTMGSIESERTVTGFAAKDPSGILSPYTYTLRSSSFFLSPSSPSSSLSLLSLSFFFVFLLQKHRSPRCFHQSHLLWNLPL